MRYILSNDKAAVAYRTPVKTQSSVHQFIEWAAGQDKDHHIAWTGVCLLATTAVLFPLTMTFILINGAVFSLILIAMVALVVVVTLNLAAMPTRYTIPAFFLGALIDAALILTTMLY